MLLMLVLSLLVVVVLCLLGARLQLLHHQQPQPQQL
jgi:hypothetical protein